LIYCMGDEVDDILRGQALSEVQRHQYQAVRDTLDTYFVPRKNIIYERARFNQRVHQCYLYSLKDSIVYVFTTCISLVIDAGVQD
uniref:Uncharacterized protein n=1 Tax=Acanthochromis polyacanthus TaxID=80966 RepID=A0A3Q1FP05_9TELE